VDIRNADVASSSSVPSTRGQQKPLLSCNFRLGIDGVDGSRVKAIGAFGLKHGKPSGPMVLTVSEQHASTFRAWQGTPGAKNASLDLFDKKKDRRPVKHHHQDKSPPKY